MSSTKSSVVILLDLDGVLVENNLFEDAVTSLIVAEFASKYNLSIEGAQREWRAALLSRKNAPNWHDYKLHCETLNLGEVWKQAHEQSCRYLSAMPAIMDELPTLLSLGQCWIVSDATEWVIDFKLQSVGLDKFQFSELFSLTRCGVSKQDKKYWRQVHESLGEKLTCCVYVDNRSDLLSIASQVIPSLKLVLVPAKDHPQSLNIWSPLEVGDNIAILKSEICNLASLVKSQIQESKLSQI